MWILATDVRDGQRLAFPQFSTVVSFDVQSYRERIEEQMREQERKSEDITYFLRASQRLQQHLHQIDEEVSNFERHEQQEQTDEQVEQKVQAELRRLRSIASKLATVEALLYFGSGSHSRPWVVRSVMYTTSWDSVMSYTRSGVDTGAPDELPDLDNLTDRDEQP